MAEKMKMKRFHLVSFDSAIVGFPEDSVLVSDRIRLKI